MKVLDLFSGIGGFSLGLERAGMETLAFCEKEPFCQKVLQKHWPDVPIFDDIRSLSVHDLEQKPDLVCGGYPCQPFSVAGKQRGSEDDRHLWPEMLRVIQECRPTWVIAENVAGHIRLGLDKVLFDLETEGYFAQPFVIPACAINAPHRRDRVWIVGYAEHDGSPATSVGGKPQKDGDRAQKGPAETVESEGAGRRANHEALADSRCTRVQVGIPEQAQRQKRQSKKLNNRSHRFDGGTGGGFWAVEPGVGRVADGVPARVDRIKALGNAVVPQIPELIGRVIMHIEQQQE